MSREKMEIVQAAYDAYLRGDMERLLELVSPSIVVNQPPEQPDLRAYEGHDGLILAMDEWAGVWDDYRLEVLEMSDADPHVLVTVRQTGRGKASGAEVESTVIFVHTVEAGAVTRWRMFMSEEQAREAVGLRESRRSGGNA